MVIKNDFPVYWYLLAPSGGIQTLTFQAWVFNAADINA